MLTDEQVVVRPLRNFTYELCSGEECFRQRAGGALLPGERRRRNHPDRNLGRRARFGRQGAPKARCDGRTENSAITWDFRVPDVASAAGAWVVVTWLRSHLEGVASEAIAQWLIWHYVHVWRVVSPTTATNSPHG